ncbi:MAG TPA: hypothetical protein H9911_07955 [Candidatus Mediterraneibacter tabaqchaliae]|uniref:Uncharacterized protein n=1 Tax=Candidatus Mediterraneibacter tabaqchaliae TaxID=2838689 RepID=A0A9D2U340_9FIRM|nr:hypothetical protein [Candidatus Mediterraneibacter tabaqchaliae]
MDIKNMKYEKVYLTAGLVFSAVLGTLSHFFYEWSGQNPVVALVSPVNESTWEHMKLVFFPILVWSLLLPAGIRKDFPAMRCALLAGGLLGTWLVPVLFYTYSGILGRNLALIDIGIFYTAVLAAFWTARKLRDSERVEKACPFILFISAVMLLAFFLFTFVPPDIGLFAEP